MGMVGEMEPMAHEEVKPNDHDYSLMHCSDPMIKQLSEQVEKLKAENEQLKIDNDNLSSRNGKLATNVGFYKQKYEAMISGDLPKIAVDNYKAMLQTKIDKINVNQEESENPDSPENTPEVIEVNENSSTKNPQEIQFKTQETGVKTSTEVKKPYRCGFCSEKFLFSKRLTKHVIDNHRKCSQAQMTKRVTNSQAKISSYRCGICDKKFQTGVNLTYHIKTAHINES